MTHLSENDFSDIIRGRRLFLFDTLNAIQHQVEVDICWAPNAFYVLPRGGDLYQPCCPLSYWAESRYGWILDWSRSGVTPAWSGLLGISAAEMFFLLSPNESDRLFGPEVREDSFSRRLFFARELAFDLPIVSTTLAFEKCLAWHQENYYAQGL